MDSRQWRIVCLSILSVEDVEDVYMIEIITGFLLFGFGSFLFYRKLRKMQVAILANEKLSIMMEGMSRAVNTQTQAICELNRKQTAISKLLSKMDDNKEKLSAQLG